MFEYIPKNAIIFIDEVDKIINSSGTNANAIKTFLLKLLDTEPFQKLNDLSASNKQIDADMSRYLYILAGNDIPRDPNAIAGQISPLVDRLHMVEFKGMSFDNKMTIADRYLQRLCSVLEISHEKSFMDQMLHDMISYDHDQLGNKGLRPLLKTIDNYSSYLKNKEADEIFDFKSSLDTLSLNVVVPPPLVEPEPEQAPPAQADLEVNEEEEEEEEEEGGDEDEDEDGEEYEDYMI